MEETMEYTLAAIAIIQEKTKAKPEFEPTLKNKKEGCVGKIECPKCGGILHYSVAGGNHHIWGTCETKDCLKWMM